MPKATVVCPYCSKAASLLKNSGELYHGRNYGPVWLCRPCQAWVGCHKNTTRPLGRLANAELRAIRIKAHSAFDPLWRNGRMPRQDAYALLASGLGINPSECHIGMFDEQRCRDVIAVSRGLRHLYLPEHECEKINAAEGL